MDYHAHNKSRDDIIRMPVDGLVFNEIEKKWPHFKEDPHNLKLSLVADSVKSIWRYEIYSLGVVYFCYQQ